MATSDFFITEAKAGQQCGNRGMVNLDPLCCYQRIAQFKERDIRILNDKVLEKRPIRSQLASSTGASLWCRIRAATHYDHAYHLAPVAGESFSRNAAARPLRPSSIYC